jgi:hypothetical protein
MGFRSFVQSGQRPPRVVKNAPGRRRRDGTSQGDHVPSDLSQDAAAVQPASQPIFELAYVVRPVHAEDAKMFQRPQLFVLDAAVIVDLVHLQCGKAQYPIGRPAVADHALGPAGIMPRLLARGTRLVRIMDLKNAIRPRRGDKFGLGLRVVPKVGITLPLSVLLRE